jgi:hypothetical protein
MALSFSARSRKVAWARGGKAGDRVCMQMTTIGVPRSQALH